MTTTTLARAVDTFADQNRADRNFADRVNLSLNGNSGGNAQRQSFLFFGGLPPIGSTVIDATLSVYLRGAWSGGPHTITAKRVTESWKASRLTWAKRPSVTATNSGSAAVTGGAGGDLVEIDVTALIQDAVAAGVFYGIRLELDTSGTKNLESADQPDPDLRPVLEVDWASQPLAATDLKPAGGRQVSIAKPVLQWTYADLEGDDQAELQVQIDDADDFATPVFDSGWVVSTLPELDLADTAYGGIAAGTTRYWRVRVKNAAGVVSDWSDAAEFGRTNQGTLSLSAPGATVEETTPPVTHSLSGATQAEAEYLLDERDAAGIWRRVYTKRRFATTATTFTLPAGLVRIPDRDYRVTVRIWDTVDREGTPGDPTYTEQSQVFQWTAAVSPPTAPTTLVAAGEADAGPGVSLTWSRSSQPDYWAILVDGVAVEDRIPGADASAGGTDYAWTLYSVTPNAARTIEVQAVVDDAGVLKHSASAQDTITHRVVGLWLVDTDEDPARKVRLLGRDPADLRLGEAGTTYYPVGRQDPVRVTDAVRGFEGRIAGLIDDTSGTDYRGALEQMKGATGRTYRLVAGDLNVPVALADVATLTPHPTESGLWLAAVEVFQIGEFAVPVP